MDPIEVWVVECGCVSLKFMSGQSNVGTNAANRACLVFGVLGTAATLYLLADSQIIVQSWFDTPMWLQIAIYVWIPIGFAGAPVTWFIARRGEERTASNIGLVLTLLALAGFVAAQFIAG